MKLAVVTSIPTPYRDPFWNEVAAHPDVESLDVYYCAAGKPDRPWEVDWERRFNSHFLPSYNLAKWAGADASAYWVRGLQKALKREAHDAVIVGGYNHPSMLQTIRGCISRKQPFFLMCETYRRRKTWKSLVKDRLLNYICRRAAGGMPTGKLATAYLQSYGIPEKRMVQVPNVPDVRHLRRLGAQIRQSSSEVRSDLGVPESAPVVTFVGRMIPKKRPLMCIRAFAASAPENGVLLMVGDGPLLAECREVAAALGIGDRVVFTGFCQPSEVPNYVAVASLFLLPSSETWGVAAIEACSLGVRLVLSDEVGCHPDVVRTDENGIVVKAGSEVALTEALEQHFAAPQQPSDESIAFVLDDFAYDNLSMRSVGQISAQISI